MSVRALNASHDWEFGFGRGCYLLANQAVAQNINTRLSSFLGDCFFDLNAGIDWFNYLGAKDQTTLNLAISTTIMNTANVTGILQLFINLNPQTRNLLVQYSVQTTYSVTQGSFVYSQGSI